MPISLTTLKIPVSQKSLGFCHWSFSKIPVIKHFTVRFLQRRKRFVSGYLMNRLALASALFNMSQRNV